jgi:hypothetical protein
VGFPAAINNPDPIFNSSRTTLSILSTTSRPLTHPAPWPLWPTQHPLPCLQVNYRLIDRSIGSQLSADKKGSDNDGLLGLAAAK